jgi:hypothetical protein
MTIKEGKKLEVLNKLLALEFGFRAAENGHNLAWAKAELKKTTYPSKPRK